MFPKTGVFNPKSSHLFIGFSMIFTIHFGSTIIFWKHPNQGQKMSENSLFWWVKWYKQLLGVFNPPIFGSTPICDDCIQGLVVRSYPPCAACPDHGDPHDPRSRIGTGGSWGTPERRTLKETYSMVSYTEIEQKSYARIYLIYTNIYYIYL